MLDSEQIQSVSLTHIICISDVSRAAAGNDNIQMELPPQKPLVVLKHQPFHTTTSRPVLRPFLIHLDTLLSTPNTQSPPLPPLHAIKQPQNPNYTGHIGQGQHGQVTAVQPCILC